MASYTWTTSTHTYTIPTSAYTYCSYGTVTGTIPKRKTPEELEKECETRGNHMIQKNLKCFHCNKQFEL